jgi:hypothetical protein
LDFSSPGKTSGPKICIDGKARIHLERRRATFRLSFRAEIPYTPASVADAADLSALLDDIPARATTLFTGDTDVDHR